MMIETQSIMRASLFEWEKSFQQVARRSLCLSGLFLYATLTLWAHDNSQNTGIPPNEISGAIPDGMREVAQQAADDFEQKNYDAATAIYQSMIKAHPDSLYAWSNLGVVRFQQRRYPEARDAFKQALMLNPTDALCLTDLGNIYVELDDLPDALATWKTAADVNPSDPRPHDFLSLVYQKLGQAQEAEAERQKANALSKQQVFNTLVRLPPPSTLPVGNSLQARYLRAYLEIDGGNKDLAANHLQEGRGNFSQALAELKSIQATDPEWEKALVTHRIAETEADLAKLDQSDSTHDPQNTNASPAGDRALDRALVAAAQAGDPTKIGDLLNQGADPNANVQPDGNNALFTAAINSRTDVVKLLLQHGADPNGKNACGNRPIDWVLDQGHLNVAMVLHDAGATISPEQWAAATGDLATLKTLLGPTPSQKNIDDAMKYAVSMGRFDVAQYLEGVQSKPVAGKFLSQAARSGNLPMLVYMLKQGVDIKKDGGNALDQAVIFFDQPEAAKFLLTHGADPNRFTPWQQYILSEAKNAAMVKVLLDSGANPNVEDMFGTPLSRAPDVESVRLQVGHGAELKPKLKNGETLIEKAISRGPYANAAVIDELIKQGAEFDPQDNGARALVDAAQMNQVHIMALLMDRGVSPNAFSKDPFHQITALGSAAWEPSPDAVKLLLERGANPAGDPREDMSPLGMAIMFGQTKNADMLRNAGAHDVGELSLAAAAGDAAKVADLLTNGANINETDHGGNTPLYYAVRRGHPEVAELLLQHGANANLFNSQGVTPKLMFDLMMASRNPRQFQADWGVSQAEGQRNVAVFKALFTKYPVDPNYQNSQGWTVLHQMALSGNTMVNFLTSDKTHLVDVNLRDYNGNTPLLLAALSPLASETVTRITTMEPAKKEWNASAYIADQLIKAGARLDLKLIDGRTLGDAAMVAAKQANNPQLISVLHDAGVADDAFKLLLQKASVVIPLLEKIRNGDVPGKVRFWGILGHYLFSTVPAGPAVAGQTQLSCTLDDGSIVDVQVWTIPGHGDGIVSIDLRRPGKGKEPIYPRPVK